MTIRTRFGILRLPVATGLLGLAARESAWRAGWIDPLFFSGPTGVAGALCRLIVTGAIIPHYLTTLSATAAGLALAVVSGVIAGMAYGLSPAFRHMAGPYLAALNATPRVAMIGLLVVWLGLGMAVRVVLVWFTSILLPHTLPFLLTGTRLALGRALVVVVIAEIFVGSLGGIGYFIINAGQQFQSANVLAAAFLMAVTGCGLTIALERLGAWLTPWHRPTP